MSRAGEAQAFRNTAATMSAAARRALFAKPPRLQESPAKRRDQVIALQKKGLRIKDIAALFGVSRSIVSRWKKPINTLRRLLAYHCGQCDWRWTTRNSNRHPIRCGNPDCRTRNWKDGSDSIGVAA